MRGRLVYRIGIATTALSHLAVIPILASYGVHVCPVLEEKGFGFGCAYNSIFVLFLALGNALCLGLMLMTVSRSSRRRQRALPINSIRVTASLLYATVFILGVAGLTGYLKNIGVPSQTLSHLSVALLYTGILLGLLELAIVDWLLVVWAREQFHETAKPATPELESRTQLITDWVIATTVAFLPFAGALVIATVFSHNLVADLAAEPPIEADALWKAAGEALQVLALLAGWCVLVRFFGWLRDRCLVEELDAHVRALGRLDSEHSSFIRGTGWCHELFVALNTSSSLAKAAREAEVRKTALEKDLALTAAVQSLFLPKSSSLRTARINLMGYYQSASICSGDWWWHEESQDGATLVLLGDVTGHGPGPAMVTAAVSSNYQLLRRSNPGLTLAEILPMLNRSFVELCQNQYYMSLASICIDPARGKMTVYGAGAPSVFLAKKKEGDVLCLSARGSPLGVSPAMHLGQVAAEIDSGDRVFMFTDGVSELRLKSGRSLGNRKVMELFKRSLRLDLAASRDEIVTTLGSLGDGHPLDDDVTFVLLEVA